MAGAAVDRISYSRCSACAVMHHPTSPGSSGIPPRRPATTGEHSCECRGLVHGHPCKPESETDGKVGGVGFCVHSLWAQSISKQITPNQGPGCCKFYQIVLYDDNTKSGPEQEISRQSQWGMKARSEAICESKDQSPRPELSIQNKTSRYGAPPSVFFHGRSKSDVPRCDQARLRMRRFRPVCSSIPTCTKEYPGVTTPVCLRFRAS
jgi:hypothetical protein